MEALKWLREEHEESQKDLANFLKVSQSAIGKWERGENEPGIDALKKLAEHYDASIDYLVGYTNQRKKHGTVNGLLAEYMTRTYKRAYSEHEIKCIANIINILENYRE